MSEQKVFDYSDKWSKQLKQFLVAFSLIIAAFLMVMAWIFHLNWASSITFWQAFGISISFVIIEFLINTFITRYAINKKLFNQSQLATLSIISGVFFIFIVGIIIKENLKGDKEQKIDKKTIALNITGLFIIAIGSIFVLYEE